jgi:SET domain-containing protein
MLLTSIVARPSPAHGLGLFASEPIPRGTVVWHPCARCPVLSPQARSSLGRSQLGQLEEYGYYLEDGDVILPCGLTFLHNHSCEANVLDHGLDFGIAVRDIPAGAEVTLDYRTFVSDPGWEVQCTCGAEGCAGLIGPARRLDGLTDVWSEKVAGALAALYGVPQPLGESLTASSRAYAASGTAGFAPDPARYSIRRPRSGLPTSS